MSIKVLNHRSFFTLLEPIKQKISEHGFSSYIMWQEISQNLCKNVSDTFLLEYMHKLCGGNPHCSGSKGNYEIASKYILLHFLNFFQATMFLHLLIKLAHTSNFCSSLRVMRHLDLVMSYGYKIIISI